MIKKILIANRSEIVLRVIRSCNQLGISTVAVYSDPDKDAPHVRAAIESFPLGGIQAKDSYLRGDKILHIAKACGADAIHPGYGFLSENPEFQEAVTAAGLIFIGPSATTMRRLGHKDAARITAKQSGVPVVPGYDGDDQKLSTLQQEANKVGFPLVIKAVSGGGGKGMRIVQDKAGLEDALASAKREATSFFGSAQIILERYLSPARHIEVQLIGDSFGNVLHLFERDCSLQRKQQKVIEESPAIGLSPKLREQLLQAAVLLGREVGLSNAITAEFLVPIDEPEAFYFLEANCRLQVEHPVTEMITGLDLVQLQIQCAAGEKLQLTQKQITSRGHAIEVRICAELPGKSFAPATGMVVDFHSPDISKNAPRNTRGDKTGDKTVEAKHIRLDHGVAAGLQIGANYDSLLAKLIVSGETREEALSRLLTVLPEISITGIETNIPLILALLEDQQFKLAKVSTEYLDKQLAVLLSQTGFRSLAPIALSTWVSLNTLLPVMPTTQDPFSTLKHWRQANADGDSKVSLSGVVQTFSLRSDATGDILTLTAQLCQWDSLTKTASVLVNDTPILISVLALHQTHATLKANNEIFSVFFTKLKQNALGKQVQFLQIRGQTYLIERDLQSHHHQMLGDGILEKEYVLLAHLPGHIIGLHIKPEQAVAEGETIITIESMKMEHNLLAEHQATVKEIHVAPGDTVNAGQILITFTRV